MERGRSPIEQSSLEIKYATENGKRDHFVGFSF